MMPRPSKGLVLNKTFAAAKISMTAIITIREKSVCKRCIRYLSLD